jgi:hypothetical protein
MTKTIIRLLIAGGLAASISGGALAQGMPNVQNMPHAQGQGMPHGGAMMQNEDRSPRMSRRAERFTRLYDLNGDGKVTVDEINGDQARMFGAMDLDGDKALSIEEMRRRGRSLQLWRTVSMFDLLDVNGDGRISVDEIQGPTRRWFARHDANKDGILSADELPSRRGRGGRGRERGHR